MTQEQRVIQYIETYGSISPLEAFRDLGITKLATIVSRLTLQCGMTFYKAYLPAYNRFGEVVYYMRYWLDEERYKDEIRWIKGDSYEL
jgi:hypothetical protein